PWIGAILQVREQHSPIGVRTVRLLVEKSTDIAAGDAMTVRFLDRVRSTTGRVAFGAMALI
ncbi:MAG: FMN adenylyltransferase, partial [Caballeronia sp.]